MKTSHLSWTIMEGCLSVSSLLTVCVISRLQPSLKGVGGDTNVHFRELRMLFEFGDFMEVGNVWERDRSRLR